MLLVEIRTLVKKMPTIRAGKATLQSEIDPRFPKEGRRDQAAVGWDWNQRLLLP